MKDFLGRFSSITNFNSDQIIKPLAFLSRRDLYLVLLRLRIISIRNEQVFVSSISRMIPFIRLQPKRPVLLPIQHDCGNGTTISPKVALNQ